MGGRRLRLTVRRMMVAVAVVATLVYLGTLLMRPYPTIGIFNGVYNVAWSDGSSTTYRSWEDHPSRRVRHLGPIVWVLWKDGSSSLHLRDTPRKARPGRPLEGPLGIPKMANVSF